MSHNPSSRPAPLSPRDRHILEHVARHHLSLYHIVSWRFFRGQGQTAAIKVISRLCQAGYLQRVRILRRQFGFVLTPRAAKLLGVSTKGSTFPGPQSLPIDLALLLYATSARSWRRRLTRSELRSAYPWMTSALANLPHCLDETAAGDPCLELIRVDLGGKPDHVARKCHADIGRRRHCTEFHELLRTAHFRLVVITTTRGKADLIRQALDRHAWPDGLAIQLAVLPQLASFIGPDTYAP